jgi:hypothetical protein
MASVALWDDPICLWDDTNFDWDGNYVGPASIYNQILPPAGGTGTICRLIDILEELYFQEKKLVLTDSAGQSWKIYDLIKLYVYPASWYTQRIEFKPGLRSIFAILPNGNRQVPPIYTLNSPWHG